MAPTRLRILFLLSFVVPICSFSQSFSISGYTQGFVDSTWIYLCPNGSTPQDSALILNGKFIITVKAFAEPTKMILQTRRPSNYTSIWLTTKDIHLFLSNGSFEEAIILGSDLNREQSVYYAQLKYLYRLRDSLSALGKRQTDSALKNVLRQERDAVEQRRVFFEQDYVKRHPQSLIAANVLNIYKSTWSKELVQELYQQFSPAIKESYPGKLIRTFLNIAKIHEIGDRYSDFEQPNYKGEMKKLSDIKGKYVLLEFWASWCLPCREENPNLVATYKKFKDKGFEIFGVSLDTDPGSWVRAIKKDGLLWENVSELTGDDNTAFLLYSGNDVPANFLIDPKGIIIAKDLRGESLNAKLKELLDK